VGKKHSERSTPVIWQFSAGKTSAYGIFVDDNRCWIGNSKGDVFALDHEGNVLLRYKLPDGVMALVGDGAWMYAGCNNGNVYDITGKTPRLAYEIDKDNPIDWLDIRDGLLAISLAEGGLTLIDPESQVLWSKKGKDGDYTVRIDSEAVYHADQGKLNAYERVHGTLLWSKRTAGILFGWQTQSGIYVGTTDYEVLAFAKKTGRRFASYHCDGGAASCATSPDGEFVFAGAMGHITCFAADSKRLWHLKSGCGHPLSMQYHNGLLYIATTDGYLGCIDLTPAAIAKAEAGQAAKAREITAAKMKPATHSRTVPTTTSSTGGVVVKCVEEGSTLRVRVVSRGYHKAWNVQFPRDIRKKGVRFVVEEVREVTQGGFYRAYGTIKKLVHPAKKTRN
jgi:outer membrane protein assembly factor BamB